MKELDEKTDQPDSEDYKDDFSVVVLDENLELQNQQDGDIIPD